MATHTMSYENNDLVGDQLVVNTDKMREKAEELNNQIKRLEEALEAMRTDVVGMAEIWDGPAHQAYDESFDGLYSRAKETVNKFKRFPVIIFEQAYAFDVADKKAMDAAEYAQQMVERLAGAFQST